MSFSFMGKVPSSKSIFNRALVIGSYSDDVNIIGDSICDDVTYLKAGIEALKANRPIECGEAGTVLRFLALRASRQEGHHELVGSERLFSRPMDELVHILNQMAVKHHVEKSRLIIDSQGWNPMGDSVMVHCHRSSQFASALLLNAWDLPFPLGVSLTGKMVSRGYYELTLRMLKEFGMSFEVWDKDIRILHEQRVKPIEYVVEPDMSSAFAVAAIAVASGTARILNFPEFSLQPDFKFIQLLRQMGAPIEFNKSQLKVQKAAKLKPIESNLVTCPDIFPVLATLCAFADGVSELYGASHLIYKESNRLENMAQFIRQLGREVEVKKDGLKIYGRHEVTDNEIVLDSDHDHRMVMAAGVAKAKGVNIKVLNPNVVTKSFPEFLAIANIGEAT